MKGKRDQATDSKLTGSTEPALGCAEKRVNHGRRIQETAGTRRGAGGVQSRGGPTVEEIQVLGPAEDTENNISQKPVATSAMAIDAQPYWSVAACSGKIRLPKHMIVTMTEANTLNADRILGIYLDLKNR